MVSPAIVELPSSSSVSVLVALKVWPHGTAGPESILLTSGAVSDGVPRAVICFSISIDAAFDVAEEYSVFPAKLADTVMALPVVLTAVIVTEPVSPLPSVVPDGEPDTAV